MSQPFTQAERILKVYRLVVSQFVAVTNTAIIFTRRKQVRLFPEVSLSK
jgi:hypothetical protein